MVQKNICSFVHFIIEKDSTSVRVYNLSSRKGALP